MTREYLRLSQSRKKKKCPALKAALGKAASPLGGRALKVLSTHQSSGKPAAAPGLDLWLCLLPMTPEMETRRAQEPAACSLRSYGCPEAPRC